MISRIIDAGLQALNLQAPVLFVQVAAQAVATVAPELPGVEMLAEVRDELAILAFSGVAGAFCKAVMFPRGGWKSRTLYGASSAFTAVFLGGVVGALLVKLGAPEVYSFLGAGFLMGFAGRDGVLSIQSRVMGGGAK